MLFSVPRRSARIQNHGRDGVQRMLSVQWTYVALYPRRSARTRVVRVRRFWSVLRVFAAVWGWEGGVARVDGFLLKVSHKRDGSGHFFTAETGDREHPGFVARR